MKTKNNNNKDVVERINEVLDNLKDECWSMDILWFSNLSNENLSKNDEISIKGWFIFDNNRIAVKLKNGETITIDKRNFEKIRIKGIEDLEWVVIGKYAICVVGENLENGGFINILHLEREEDNFIRFFASYMKETDIVISVDINKELQRILKECQELGLLENYDLMKLKEKLIKYDEEEGILFLIESYKEQPNNFLNCYLFPAIEYEKYFMIDWKFNSDDVIYGANQILKEYNIRLKCLEYSQEKIVDKEKRIRKTKIGMNTPDRVVLFQTPSHIMYEVNKIISNKKIVFLEVDTGADSYGFLLTNIENMNKILSSDKIKAWLPKPLEEQNG